MRPISTLVTYTYTSHYVHVCNFRAHPILRTCRVRARHSYIIRGHVIISSCTCRQVAKLPHLPAICRDKCRYLLNRNNTLRRVFLNALNVTQILTKRKNFLPKDDVRPCCATSFQRSICLISLHLYLPSITVCIIFLSAVCNK